MADRLLEPANATPVCGDTAVESVKDGWDYTLSESGKAAINAVREQMKEERLKPESPEPVLPNGWTRPSKAYPQVAEDPSTRWQYLYDGERWLRLVNPIHEMSEKELKHLDMGGDFPYPIVFPPDLNRLLPYPTNGWKFHQRTLDS